jgi:hypothetical protein
MTSAQVEASLKTHQLKVSGYYIWPRSNWRYAVVGTLPEFVIYVTAKLLN